VLTHIQIRDLAIIDSVELELGAGLTVLTGETGVGKSILVDALLLAAGGRAGAEVVRHGSERAEVSATFSVEANAAALEWTQEQAIEHDGECVLRRVVSSEVARTLDRRLAVGHCWQSRRVLRHVDCRR
jgi:DNA repair protein RecN (Recombination protein N)